MNVKYEGSVMKNMHAIHESNIFNVRVASLGCHLVHYYSS